MDIKETINNSPLPRRETELLLAFLLNKPREYLLTHPETKITPVAGRRFLRLAERRKSGLPIAYLTGEKEFYGLNFRVSESVLVPRPATELIIDLVLAELSANSEPLAIIDIGTGSGAIIITLADRIKKLWPNLSAPNLSALNRFYGTDISASALKVARLNARHYSLNDQIKFYQGDLLSALPRSALFKSSLKNIVITANLPYLTPKQIKQSPSISAEPILALDGGPDGLKYYRRLFKQIKNLARDYLEATRQIIIYCEIDPSQVIAFKKSAQFIRSTAKLTVYKDYQKNNRVIKITL